jgi:formylmethanofuran dehydrogenase subunit E
LSTLTAYLEQSAALHRHLCPRQVLGVRMGLLAHQCLGLTAPRDDKRLHVFAETDGCLVSGLMVVTGCGVHRRTLHLLDYGKMAATFVDTKTNRAIRIHPHPASRQNAKNAVPEAQSRWHAMLEAYQTLPDEALLVLRPVKLTIDLVALVSRAGIRAQCDQCSEEIFNGREIRRDGQTLCKACAGEHYYSD